MKTKKVHADEQCSQPSSTLRERALATHQSRTVDIGSGELSFSTAEALAAIHELQVHQIELELQNEEILKTQSELEESRQRYLDLYDHAPVGYCLVGADGMIQEANSSMAEMLGVSQGSLPTERFSKFVDERDQDAFYLLRRLALQSSEPQTCELRVKKSVGTLAWYQLSALAIPAGTESGQLRIVLLDIDTRIRAEAEKKSLESQLRESQKMEAMGTLAGGIAHDFNNILAIILGNAELAKHHAGLAESPVTHCVEEIRKAGERARELVKQLLAFCRRQPTDRKSIALAPVIEDSIRLLRATIPARIDVSFDCSQQVPNVLADFTQIEQIIINLATNAVQALNGSSGAITIHLDTVERSTNPNQAESLLFESKKWQNYNRLVRITFSDDGPGMDSTVLARIFEPFFTTKSAEEGTGLGLAVVHGIIQAHDGEVTVDSRPGHGVTFTIYFPPASSSSSEIEIENSEAIVPSVFESSSTVAKTATTTSTTAPNYRVLYIDDDAMVLQSIVNLLAHNGMQVQGYSDHLSALAALRADKDKFDLVVTDYNMPGLSGLEVASLVREIRSDIPVIVTSGFIDEKLHRNADEAGVRALIPKPFSAKYFCDVVKKLLT